MQTETTPIEVIDAELVMASEPTLPQQRPFLERMLSPRNLSALMFTGGALLVLGFAVWLWSIGVFENPIAVAFSVGTMNFGLLAAGIFLFQLTCYKIAGRGLALLAGMILPLNLWLYDSQGLITIQDGNLWVAALICSIVYAGVARLMRDHLFVYALVGGIVLTGVLFLAGSPAQFFWTALPIATFLILIGTACVHIDLFFVEGNGNFSRDKFGLAFFRAGHFVVFCGLAMLFASPWITEFVSASQAKIWTLCLLAVSTYCFQFSNRTVRSHPIFNWLTVAMSVWAMVFMIQIVEIEISLSIGLILMSIAIFVANVFRNWFPFRNNLELAIHVGIGLLSFSASYSFGLFDLVSATALHAFDWWTVLQLLTAALSAMTFPGAWNKYFDHGGKLAVGFAVTAFVIAVFAALANLLVVNPNWYFFAIAGSTLVMSLGLLKSSEKLSIVSNSTVAASLLTWTWLGATSNTIEFTSIASMTTILLLAASSLITNYATGSRFGLLLAGSLGKILFAQFAIEFELYNGFAAVSAINLAGLGILAFATLRKRFNQTQDSGLQTYQLKNIAYSIICMGAGGAFLFSLFDMIGERLVAGHLAILVFQLVTIGFAAWSTPKTDWRKAFLLAATMIVGITVLVHFNLSTLTMVQRLEIGSLALGMLMVAAGHIGWSKEGASQNNAVSFNLAVGSLLLVLPLMIGVVFDRVAADSTIGVWRMVHEIGAIVVGLLFMGSGILCRIRSTTICGVALLSVFVFGNLLLIDFPDQLQTTSAVMMIGGGAFFAVAIVLSIYRDQILQIPDKIKSGKGIFQVLKWR